MLSQTSFSIHRFVSVLVGKLEKGFVSLSTIDRFTVFLYLTLWVSYFCCEPLYIILELWLVRVPVLFLQFLFIHAEYGLTTEAAYMSYILRNHLEFQPSTAEYNLCHVYSEFDFDAFSYTSKILSDTCHYAVPKIY